MLEIEPQEPGSGYTFINKIVGGAIPKEYIPAIDEGVQDAMQNGVLGGYQVLDVKVTLVDGSYHEVDSSEIAFRIAGSMGFKEGCRRADPVLLEPIMSVDLVVPEVYPCNGDLIPQGEDRGHRDRAHRSLMPYAAYMFSTPRAGTREGVFTMHSATMKVPKLQESILSEQKYTNIIIIQ